MKDNKENIILENLWLSGIPSKWQFNRLKDVFSFGTGLSITKANLNDIGIPCVNYGEIHSKYGFEVNPTIHSLKCVSENYLLTSKKCLLKQGDFVFADTSEDIQGSGNFTYLNSDVKTFAGYHTIIGKPKFQLNHRFVAYLLESNHFRSQFRSNVVGIKVYSITQALINRLFIYFPNETEQTQIAHYLDTKTQAIDKKINLLTTKIEYYKELRKTIINTMVSGKMLMVNGKALPANQVKMVNGKYQKSSNQANQKNQGSDNVQLKESELGLIPSHWVVKRIKDVCKTIAGGTPATNNPDYWVGNIPWIPSGKVQNNIVIAEIVEDYISKDALLKSSTKMAKRNSILIALTGATCSNIGYLTFDTAINQSIVALSKIGNNLSEKYIYYLLISQREKLRTLMTGGAQGGINQEDVKYFLIPFPPKQEQTEIATYIDAKTSTIDAIINNLQLTINNYYELRKTLINDVVTGKVKVTD